MKNDENREIGELIQEITEKGFGGIEIDLLNGDEFDNAPFACVTVDNGTDEGVFSVEADSLIVALGLIVDSIRHQRGELSRAEELAKMLEDDDLHAAALPVELGPNAACTCGSRKPLIVERTVKVLIPWNGLEEFFEWPGFFAHYDSSITIQPIPGEIGVCPDCGNHWTFQA